MFVELESSFQLQIWSHFKIYKSIEIIIFQASKTFVV
jgi:hypothetical protein